MEISNLNYSYYLVKRLLRSTRNDVLVRRLATRHCEEERRSNLMNIKRLLCDMNNLGYELYKKGFFSQLNKICYEG